MQICCLATVSSKNQQADENVIDDEGVLEVDEDNLIDETNIGDENCENQCDQNNDKQSEDGGDGEEIQTTDNISEEQMKSNNEQAQTAESYNVKDEKSCRVKKNSEKLSKVIRKTRSVKEKSQKVNENVQNKGEKLQKTEKKVQSIIKQDKVKRESRNAAPESFKQISKKANGGKYRDQAEKNMKVKQQDKGKKSSKKSKKNEKSSQKKSQKNKKKYNKSEL